MPKDTLEDPSERLRFAIRMGRVASLLHEVKTCTCFHELRSGICAVRAWWALPVGERPRLRLPQSAYKRRERDSTEPRLQVGFRW